MATLQKSGISADPYLIKVGDYVSDKAYKAACNLLEMREQDRPTAIFAFNDLGAINVYRAARQHGISLPEQLSIIGFDDVYPAASMCPSLTTIRQPFGLIARQCIDLILEAREGGGWNRITSFFPRSLSNAKAAYRQHVRNSATEHRISFHEAPMHMKSVSGTSIYFCLPDEDTKEATKPARPRTRGMPTMKPQQNKRLRTKHEPTNETTSRVKGNKIFMMRLSLLGSSI